jgi:hypothetical protein
LIYSNDNSRAVQIRFASPMGWDAQKEEMYQGSVVYSEYVVSSGNFSKLKERECTQMQFLELLMLVNMNDTSFR